MPGSFRIGRFDRTEIGLHVTFLPMLIWAAWLGAIQYGGVNGAIFGVVAVILLFICVLIHELAHAIRARTFGVEVTNIVLLPIGGLATLEATAMRPRDEAMIAVAGPLANLAVGAVLGIAALLVASLHLVDINELLLKSVHSPSLSLLLVYLGMANLALALFNLLPVFPLDGGLILRALLSRRMSYAAATHRAAIVGRSIGAGLIAIGVTMILIGMPIYGGTTVLVAVMLYGGATYEDRVVQQNAALRTTTVGDVLRTDIHTVAPNESLSSALAKVIKGRVVLVVVGEQPRLVGLLTPHELRSIPRQGLVGELSVAHIMRTRYPTVKPGDLLWVAYDRMRRYQLAAIPVVSHGTLHGLVTLRDVHRVIRSGFSGETQPPIRSITEH